MAETDGPAVRKATKRKAASPRASEEATKKAKEHGEEMAAPKLAAPPVVSTRKRGKQPDSARKPHDPRDSPPQRSASKEPMNSAKEQEVEDLTTPPPRAKSTAPASEKKPKATKRRLSSQEAVPPQLEEAVKETATTVETAAMTELLGKNQSGEAASAQPKPKPKPAKGAKSKSEKIGTGNPQEPLMKKPGKVPKAAKAKKKDQKGADQTDQTEAPEGEAIKQEQRPTSAPAAAAVVAAEVPKVKPIRLLLKCASSSGGQQDGPPATSSEAATRMDVVDLNESRPQPSERPKWKKLLQRGKGGQRSDVDAEEAKKDPPRIKIRFPPPPSKRKTPEEDGQQPVQSKAPEADQDPAKPAPKGLARLGFHPIPKEAPKEKDLPPVEAVEVSEAPEADQDPAKPAPKGLARLGFHPIPKEAPKEKDLPPVEAVKVSEAPDATDDVVDLEAKTPRFDWKAGFAKNRRPEKALSTGDGEAQSQAPPVTEVLEVPDERDSTTTQRPLTKQGSKKVLQKEAPSLPVKDWSERNAPTVLKQLKPKKAWEDFRSWLRTWRPGQKGKEAALITGACGSGKSAGVRLIVRKWRENFIEYDLADVKGRSFFENLAKKQRNGNQLSEEASAQVLICNISEPITVTQKESLALAIQASKVPIVFTGPDGIFTSKDAISKLCFELRISLAESSIAKQIHEVSRRENAELPMELCTQVAEACPQDLRKALQVAQLLSAGVLSGSVGGACLPQTALAPLTAYDRLLRKPEECCLEEAMELVEMDDAHPLVQWNCLPALAFAFDRRSWAAKASNLVELDQEEKEARKTEDDNHLETKDDKEEESQLIEEDEKDEEKEENQREAEDENCPEEDRKETVEGEVLKAEEESFPEEKEDPPAEAEIEPSAQADVEMTSPPEVWSIEVSQAELQDLETCARITSLLALSDVANYLAQQAAEEAGPTMDLRESGMTSPADAEPLLLARLTLEVQRFGRSSQGTRKFFQPMKGLQDPVCPITMDQVAQLALQLEVPKAWILDRVYDWIVSTHKSPVGHRTLKNFRAWLKRQVQLWQQRQAHVRSPPGGEAQQAEAPSANVSAEVEIAEPVETTEARAEPETEAEAPSANVSAEVEIAEPVETTEARAEPETEAEAPSANVSAEVEIAEPVETSEARAEPETEEAPAEDTPEVEAMEVENVEMSAPTCEREEDEANPDVMDVDSHEVEA